MQSVAMAENASGKEGEGRMTVKAEAGSVALCPYCNSTNRHHWPDGCISHLQAEVTTLKEQLAKAYGEPLARYITEARVGARHV